MENILYANSTRYQEVDIYECGTAVEKSGQCFGPAVRNIYLMHFVTKGRGIFSLGGRDYNIEAGQGFIVCPDILTWYRSGENDTWNYCWIGFRGREAEDLIGQAGITPDTPVFSLNDTTFIEDCFEQIMCAGDIKRGRESLFKGWFYLIMSRLIEMSGAEVCPGIRQAGNERYVQRVIDFIESGYPKKITLPQMAHHVGLDPKYLCAVFKQYTGSSPHQFLINTRMNRACELMRNKSLSIGDISRSVGYEDPLLFSRMFKKVKGISPREYRERY